MCGFGLFSQPNLEPPWQRAACAMAPSPMQHQQIREETIYGSEIVREGGSDNGKSLSMNASDDPRPLATLGDPQLLPLGAYRRVIPGQVCTCRWSQMYRSKNKLCHIEAAMKNMPSEWHDPKQNELCARTVTTAANRTKGRYHLC